MRHLLFASLAPLLLTLAGCTKWQQPDAQDPYGMRFELLDCRGDWPDDLPIEAIVRKEPAAHPSYFVQDPVTCGMEVFDPRYTLSLDTLTLTLAYSIRTPASGEVAACICEYDSRFTFAKLPPQVTSVRFEQD
ncbi:hypothetical protein [Pseudoxanthomonas sp.]|uniref:hypothetical protein n=1 Tax=Pseudoxanthomonas sp. TaxID=1871049 RepID=UPI0026283973|nr:hypothetical protein [Pseudoxanthomonas sp.]WDS36172.1 MAG: hypothetical protein O8I58_18190 [Pseudoxanthomonas sp.]